MNNSENNINDQTDTLTQSMIGLKRNEYNNIVNKVIEQQLAIDVLTKAIERNNEKQAANVITNKDIETSSSLSVFKRKIDSENDDKNITSQQGGRSSTHGQITPTYDTSLTSSYENASNIYWSIGTETNTQHHKLNKEMKDMSKS